MKQSFTIVFLGLVILVFREGPFEASCYSQTDASIDPVSTRASPFERLAAAVQQNMDEELPVAFVYQLLSSPSLPTIHEGIRAARTHSQRALFAADLKRIIVENRDLNTQVMAIHSLPGMEFCPDVLWMESVVNLDRALAGGLHRDRIFLIESIRMYKSPELADTFLKRISASVDTQVRLAAIVACSERPLTEISSAIFHETLQSSEFVNFGISSHLIDGGQLRYQAARHLTSIPRLDAKLIDQLELMLNEAVAQSDLMDPKRETLLESRSILISLAKVPEKRPWLLQCCQKLLSSSHESARRAVFEAAVAVGPVFQPIEADLARAIDHDCAEMDCFDEMELGVKSLASIGAKLPGSQEQIEKSMNHPCTRVRLAACLAAIYLKFPHSDSRELIQKIISVEPPSDEDVLLRDNSISLAQIAVATMSPKEAIEYLEEQGELLLERDDREQFRVYWPELNSAARVLQECFEIVM